MSGPRNNCTVCREESRRAAPTTRSLAAAVQLQSFQGRRRCFFYYFILAETQGAGARTQTPASILGIRKYDCGVRVCVCARADPSVRQRVHLSEARWLSQVACVCVCVQARARASVRLFASLFVSRELQGDAATAILPSTPPPPPPPSPLPYSPSARSH